MSPKIPGFGTPALEKCGFHLNLVSPIGKPTPGKMGASCKVIRPGGSVSLLSYWAGFTRRSRILSRRLEEKTKSGDDVQFYSLLVVENNPLLFSFQLFRKIISCT